MYEYNSYSIASIYNYIEIIGYETIARKNLGVIILFTILSQHNAVVGVVGANLTSNYSAFSQSRELEVFLGFISTIYLKLIKKFDIRNNNPRPRT